MRTIGTIMALALTLGAVALLAKPRSQRIETDDLVYDVTQNLARSNAQTTGPARRMTTDAYLSTLAGGLTPTPITWAGRLWRVNSVAIQVTGRDHAVRMTSDRTKVRFELRDTDKSLTEDAKKRRVELSGSLYGDRTRLPNGTSLWGAFSTLHHPWSDPAGMERLTGGVYGQIHMGSTFGGSPAVAFRRHPDGNFRITTRGELDAKGTTRYFGKLSFGDVHDIVYNLVLDPRHGRLRVWIDGVQVVNVADVSIGHRSAKSYWNLGLYFAGGVTGSVVAEYGNHIYPGTADLSARTTRSPRW